MFDTLLDRSKALVRKAILPNPVRSRGVSRSDQPLVIAGMFRSGNGLGRAALGCFEAMRAEGLTPEAVDTSGILNQIDAPASVELSVIDPRKPGTLILYANPPEFEICLMALGLRRWHNWRIIGAWVWETPRVPSSWASQTGFASELWAPSQFVTSAFEAAFDLPVRAVPHFLGRNDCVPPALGKRGDESAMSKTGASKSESPLNILAMADARSSLARKNPLAAVNMFRLAFDPQEPVHLIIKTQQLHRFALYEAELRRAIGDDSRITIIDKTLSLQQHSMLIDNADIILSPHRSEGFGLALAEAMAAGKCVVATGWSGNTDFMTSENSVLLPYSLVPVIDSTGVYPSDNEAVWADPISRPAQTHFGGSPGILSGDGRLEPMPD